MANRTKVTRTRRERFLEVLATDANVTKAAEAIGVSRKQMYELRAKNPAFKKAWDEAVELGTDALEDEAVRRGKDGVTEPVFYKGQICGGVQKYSDTLLIVMLKARRPEKFKERNELTGKDGEPLTVQIVRYGDNSSPAT